MTPPSSLSLNLEEVSLLLTPLRGLAKITGVKALKHCCSLVRSSPLSACSPFSPTPSLPIAETSHAAPRSNRLLPTSEHVVVAGRETVTSVKESWPRLLIRMAVGMGIYWLLEMFEISRLHRLTQHANATHTYTFVYSLFF